MYPATDAVSGPESLTPGGAGRSVGTEAFMNTLFRAVSCLALATVASLAASPARAAFLGEGTDTTATEVVVTGYWEYNPDSYVEGCGDFAYLQRVQIGHGPPVLVATDFVRAPGRYDLVWRGTCGDYELYGADSCEC